MDLKERKRLNIKVLRRHDPHITDILKQVSHAVVYKHDAEEWRKTDYEGPVFLTRRDTAPCYGLYLLNRQNLENYSVSLEDMRGIELQDDFIIWKQTDISAQSLWVYDVKARKPLVEEIQTLQKKLALAPGQIANPSYPPISMPMPSGHPESIRNMPSAAPPQFTVGHDLLRMLNRSQSSQTSHHAMPYPPPPPSEFEVEAAIREALQIPLQQRNVDSHSPQLIAAGYSQGSPLASPSQVPLSAIPPGGSPASSTRAVHGSPAEFSVQAAKLELMNMLRPRIPFQPAKEEEVQQSEKDAKEERVKQQIADFRKNPDSLKQRLELLAGREKNS